MLKCLRKPQEKQLHRKGYLQKQIILHNKHSEDFELWLEMTDDVGVGTRLEYQAADYLQEQRDYCNKFLTSFQLKLVVEGQPKSKLSKPQVAA